MGDVNNEIKDSVISVLLWEADGRAGLLMMSNPLKRLTDIWKCGSDKHVTRNVQISRLAVLQVESTDPDIFGDPL